MGQFFRQRPVASGEQQRIAVPPGQFEAAVTGGKIADAGPDVPGQRIFRQPPECADDSLRGFPHGTRVPDGKRRHAVGVDMLGRFDQLRESRQRIARLRVQRVIHLHQNGVVTLNDQRILRYVLGHATSGWRKGVES